MAPFLTGPKTRGGHGAVCDFGESVPHVLGEGARAGSNPERAFQERGGGRNFPQITDDKDELTTLGRRTTVGRSSAKSGAGKCRGKRHVGGRSVGLIL